MKIIVLIFILASVTSVTAQTNSVTVYEADGVTQTSRPTTFGRVFVDGEIFACPRPSVGGTPAATWQADVRNRYTDGSVKFAVISLPVSLTSGGSAAITFSNVAVGSEVGGGACDSTGGLTKTAMVNFNSGNWGADIEVTAAATTATADAKTMLNALSVADCQVEYLLQGPVVTQAKVQDCTSASAYDFGWTWNGTTMASPVTGNAATASLHPIFILSFYPSTNTVKVDYILENSWTGRDQDQVYDLVLKAGSPLAQVYTKSAITHYGRMEWRKTFWSGTASGHIRIDHNLAYLKSTHAIPQYDTVNASVDPSSDYTTFAAGDKGEIGGNALWIKSSDANNEGAPIQREDLEYLYNMSTCGTVNGLCAKAWDILTGEVDSNPSNTLVGVSGGGGMWAVQAFLPMHTRESRTDASRYFYCPGWASKDAVPSTACGGSVAQTGRPLSRDAYQVGMLASTGAVGTNVLGSGGGAGGFGTAVATVGTVTAGGWGYTEMSHWLDYAYVAYLLTGDWFYLSEEYQAASMGLASMTPDNGLWESNGFYAYITPSASTVTRRFAWGMQTVGRAAFIAPDSTVEQSYYTAKLNSNMEIQEGFWGLTGTSLTPSSTNPTCTGYSATTANRWDWARCTVGQNHTIALHALSSGTCGPGSQSNTFTVSAATAANPVVITTSQGYSTGAWISLTGGTGNWTPLNSTFQVTRSPDSTHLALNGLDGSTFGALTGTVTGIDGYTNMNTYTAEENMWMYWFTPVALGGLYDLGFTNVTPTLKQTLDRLVEQVNNGTSDANWNPYLITAYIMALQTGGSCSSRQLTGGTFLTDWPSVYNTFSTGMQTQTTFNSGVIPPFANFPCADHGYSLLARAAGTYASLLNITSTACPSGGTCTASAAQTWLTARVPYFNNSPTGSAGCGSSDAQIKYALSFRTVPVAPSCSVTSPAAGSTNTGTVTLQSSGTSTEGYMTGFQFTVDAANVGSNQTGNGPYSQSWISNTSLDGSHNLAGSCTSSFSSATAANVNVTVKNGSNPSGATSGAGAIH